MRNGYCGCSIASDLWRAGGVEVVPEEPEAVWPTGGIEAAAVRVAQEIIAARKFPISH